MTFKEAEELIQEIETLKKEHEQLKQQIQALDAPKEHAEE